MKKIYLLALAMIMAISVNAQEDEYYDDYQSEEEVYVEPELDCFQKYSKVFSERGAEAVSDGTYDNVVVVIDKGGMRDCYTGKVNVYQNKMVCSTVQLATESGDYTEGPKTRSLPVPIKDGFSVPYTDASGASVIVIFPKSLKPKPVGLKKAPEPDLD